MYFDYKAYWEIRIASVVKAPIAATHFIFLSLNNLYADKHIKIYGSRIVTTDILAS